MEERGRVKEIRQRVEAATSGRWFHHGAQKGAGEDQWITTSWDGDDSEPDGATVVCEKLEMDYYTQYGGSVRWRPGTKQERKSGIIQDRRNFKFISHAREDVPYLLELLSASLAREERMREAAELVLPNHPMFKDGAIDVPLTLLEKAVSETSGRVDREEA